MISHYNVKATSFISQDNHFYNINPEQTDAFVAHWWEFKSSVVVKIGLWYS